MKKDYHKSGLVVDQALGIPGYLFNIKLIHSFLDYVDYGLLGTPLGFYLFEKSLANWNFEKVILCCFMSIPLDYLFIFRSWYF